MAALLAAAPVAANSKSFAEETLGVRRPEQAAPEVEIRSWLDLEPGDAVHVADIEGVEALVVLEVTQQPDGKLRVELAALHEVDDLTLDVRLVKPDELPDITRVQKSAVSENKLAEIRSALDEHRSSVNEQN